ncbi:hypothetical protein Hanom_Chr13g01203241 [Helianthus anomalus]
MQRNIPRSCTPPALLVFELSSFTPISIHSILRLVPTFHSIMFQFTHNYPIKHFIEHLVCVTLIKHSVQHLKHNSPIHHMCHQ